MFNLGGEVLEEDLSEQLRTLGQINKVVSRAAQREDERNIMSFNKVFTHAGQDGVSFITYCIVSSKQEADIAAVKETKNSFDEQTDAIGTTNWTRTV